jgi:hypothetical protein
LSVTPQMDMGPTHRHQVDLCSHRLAPTVVPVVRAPDVEQVAAWASVWTQWQTETSLSVASRTLTTHFFNVCLSYYVN